MAVIDMMAEDYLDQTFVCEWAHPRSPCEITVRTCIKRYEVANCDRRYNGYLSRVFLFDKCKDCPIGRDFAEKYHIITGQQLVNFRGLQKRKQEVVFQNPKKTEL